MKRSQLTGSRASLSTFTRERVICCVPRQKLTEQAMKVIERIADSLIRQVVTIDE